MLSSSVPEHLGVVGPKLFLSVVGAKLSFEPKLCVLP